MTQATPAQNPATQPAKNKINGQAKPGRAISDPKEVAQLVMMRIDHVNSKEDEHIIAVKALADTAKQLVSVYLVLMCAQTVQTSKCWIINTATAGM